MQNFMPPGGAGIVAGLLNGLLHLVWPSHCPVCGKVGVSFCPECLASVIDPLPPFCVECGGAYGADCCADSAPCFALAFHTGCARDFVLSMKYRNGRGLARAAGILMGQSVERISADFIIPIPLHSSSSRGYNQTELMAKGLSSVWGIPVRSDLLCWNKDLSAQKGKSVMERFSLPPDSFAASGGLRGKSVVLLDDVYTTGSTLRMAKSAVEVARGAVAGALVWSRSV